MKLVKCYASYQEHLPKQAKMYPDQVHMLPEIPLKVSVVSIMGVLKGGSSLMIYEKYPSLQFKYRNREFCMKTLCKSCQESCINV